MSAFAHLLAAYAGANEAQDALLVALAHTVRAMRPTCWPLAKRAIAHAMYDEEPLWSLLLHVGMVDTDASEARA